jgi:protein TonB
MLRINTTDKKRILIWLALPASMLLHLAFIVSTEGWTKAQQTNYGSSKIEFKVKTPPPPKPPKVVELPKPIQKPKPVPRKAVIEPKRKAPPPTAKANTEQPPSREPNDAAAKPVFGVTADSVVANGGGVAVRVGNTLNKAMEHKFTEPKQVSALPTAPAVPSLRRPPKPVPSYTLTRSPSFKLKVEPVYPEDERDKGVEGTVQLEVLIDAKGSVRKVRVLKTPSRALAQAAVVALSKSRFVPGYVDLTPVAVKLKIPYRFVLNG